MDLKEFFLVGSSSIFVGLGLIPIQIIFEENTISQALRISFVGALVTFVLVCFVRAYGKWLEDKKSK